MSEIPAGAAAAQDPAAILAGIATPGKGARAFAVDRKRIVDACAALHRAGFAHLCLITGIDWRDRWEVVYHLVRLEEPEPVVLRVALPYGEARIPSVASVWPGAVWHERETYDLLGIVFEGSPDPRRILLPQDYEGFPLRKEVLYGNRS